jgi:hypothetical protein
VPVLFCFNPGDALAAAMLELAAGRITAGASRLTYGLAVLLLLGFGALLATTLVGVPVSAPFDTEVPGTPGSVAVRGGWVVFGPASC